MTSSASTKRHSESFPPLQGQGQVGDAPGTRFAPSLTLPRGGRGLLVAFLLCAPACAGWPHDRGADSTGSTPVALPDEPKVLWTYESGGSAFEATPVIGGGVVFAGDADGTVHAIRLEDGSLVWKQELGDTFLLSPGAVFAPRGADGEAAADCFVIVDADGKAHALDARDGSERWTFETNAEAYGGPTFYGLGDDGWLVLIPSEAGVLHALDLATGEERWSFEIPAPVRCTPTVVNGHVLLAGCDGKLHTVDVATGKESGACDIGDPTGNTAAPLAGVAYFGAEGGTFLAVDVSDPKKPEVKWTYRDQRRGQGVRTSAAVTKRGVYYANQSKTVYALNPADGDVLWTQRTRSAVEASPLALAGDRVLVLTGRGRVRLLSASTGDEVWSYDAGGEFLASPAASDGRVIVASTDGVVTCFGGQKEPPMNTDGRR